jgi:tellurite resistance protein
LMAEVERPALREAVLQLCVAIAEADGHVADGETLVLVAAVEQWGLQQQMFRGAAAG